MKNMNRRIWSYISGIIISVLLCAYDFYANEVIEKTVHPPDGELLTWTILIPYLSSTLFMADKTTMIVVFAGFVSIRSLAVLFDFHVCHDCDFEFALISSILEYFILILPAMYAGYRTWKFLKRKLGP